MLDGMFVAFYKKDHSLLPTVGAIELKAVSSVNVKKKCTVNMHIWWNILEFSLVSLTPTSTPLKVTI